MGVLGAHKEVPKSAAGGNALCAKLSTVWDPWEDVIASLGLWEDPPVGVHSHALEKMYNTVYRKSKKKSTVCTLPYPTSQFLWY